MLLTFILPGVIIGASAAISPGPLMTLLIAETIRYGKWAGIKVALSTLVVDVPLVTLALFFAQSAKTSPLILGALAIIGSLFLGFLSYENLRAKLQNFNTPVATSHSFVKALFANILSPYPYLVWFSIATPVFARGTIGKNVLFALSIAFSAIGIMTLLSIATEKTRKYFFDYRHWVLRVLGIALLFFAVTLFREGLRYFDNNLTSM